MMGWHSDRLSEVADPIASTVRNHIQSSSDAQLAF